MTAATVTPGSADRATTAARGAAIMTMGALAFVGYAAILFALNFTDGFFELGIGPGQIDVDRQAIEAFSPSLFDYLSHVQLAVAGFVAATGVAVASLSWFGVRRGHMWAWASAVAAPVLALAVALPAHYPAGLDTLLHIGPIYFATVVFVVGALIALPSVRSHDTTR